MERKHSNTSSEVEKGKGSLGEDKQVANGSHGQNPQLINEKDPTEVAVDAFVVDENDSK